MAEYTTISTGHTVTYQGYLDIKRYWKMVRELLIRRGYVYLEVEHNEIVEREGKSIFLKADSDRELSDDAKSRIVCDLTIHNCKDVAVDVDGATRRLQEAKVTLTVSAFLITDYEGRYQHNALLFFLRTIYEKFFGVREMKKLKRVVQRDHDDIIDEAKKYLNLVNL
jgi:type III secretory pathway component EscV